MPVPGVPELIIIFVIVAMLFGVGKLPEVFGSVGKGIREFRKNSKMDDEDEKSETAVTTSVNGTAETSEASKA